MQLEHSLVENRRAILISCPQISSAIKKLEQNVIKNRKHFEGLGLTCLLSIQPAYIVHLQGLRFQEEKGPSVSGKEEKRR